MSEVERCGSDGGRGIGAGHVCSCVRYAGHPLDWARPHGCTCGALWRCDDCEDAEMGEGCAGCGAAATPTDQPEEVRCGGEEESDV